MSELTITAVTTVPDPDDVGGRLQIEAVDDAGNTYTAQGWGSALTNHYDADQYGDDGHHLEGAKPRELTEEEVGALALRLVLEQHPGLAVRVTNAPVPGPPVSVPVAFVAAPVELTPLADAPADAADQGAV